MQKGSSSITKSKKYISVRSKRKKVFGVKDISNVKILTAVKALYEAYREWGGRHYFMVHPKGNGVIVHPNLKEGIKRGTYVNSYVGELYPPWLWERKEAEAEEKRRQKMKENGGKIILPEFWNIRLELPANPNL